MKRLASSSVFVLVSACGIASCVLACDESTSEEKKSEATAAASALPSAGPAAALEVAPAKTEPPKKKTAEDCPKTDSVEFPSADYEDAVRKKLQKPSGEITKADLGKLTSLNVSQLPMDEVDVCLYPHMTGIKELFLGGGQYDDLSPLASLTKLESLGVSRNQVKDISALSGMTKLQRLDLGRTQVEDLSPLSALTELTELMLDSTQVEDLGPISKLGNLERLGIKGTKVKNLEPLADLTKLKFLYAGGTPAADEYAFGPVKKNGTKVMTD
jgi:internalin A